MTTPDQNEARREAIQSLGDVISELPGILHPYNTATAVYAAGWRPPLPAPSDDEREALVEAMIGSDALDEDTRMRARDHTDLQREPFRMFADAALAAGFRRSPVPADTPSEGAMGRAIAEAEDRRSLAEAEANGWPITPVRAAMTLDETADFIAARLAHPTPPEQCPTVHPFSGVRCSLDAGHDEREGERGHICGGPTPPEVQHAWHPDGEGAFCGDPDAERWTPPSPEAALTVPICVRCHRRAMAFARAEERARDATPPEDVAALEAEAERILDAETHQDLCGCPTFPENCATYGTKIPWSHSDPERWVRAVLKAMQTLTITDRKDAS